MKLVQVAEQNKRYYTNEFIHGFNVGAKNQYEADKKEAERRGRWIMPQKYNNEYRCSVCGEITKRDRTPFCGWCGAKMDEVHVMQYGLYPCDPDKNDRCTKNSCYRNGGDCYLTKFEDYRK